MIDEPGDQELQASYERTLEAESNAGAAPVVAKGRALVARLRTQIGMLDVTEDDPGLTPQEALAASKAETPDPTTPGSAGEDPLFEEVFQAQLALGSTVTIARARARAASLAARRQRFPRPPTPVEPRETKPSAPLSERPAVPVASGAPEAKEPSPAQGPVAEETPDQAYERVLAEQREAGASDAVAVARAKVARMKTERAQTRVLNG